MWAQSADFTSEKVLWYEFSSAIFSQDIKGGFIPFQ